VTVIIFDYVSEFTSIKVYGGYYRPLQKLLLCYSKECILLQSRLLFYMCFGNGACCRQSWKELCS